MVLTVYPRKGSGKYSQYNTAKMIPGMKKITEMEIFGVLFLAVFITGTAMAAYNSYLQIKINRAKVKELGL